MTDKKTLYCLKSRGDRWVAGHFDSLEKAYAELEDYDDPDYSVCYVREIAPSDFGPTPENVAEWISEQMYNEIYTDEWAEVVDKDEAAKALDEWCNKYIVLPFTYVTGEDVDK